MILTVGGIKGGTGKTTIATNLAVLAARDKKNVLLVDADEQGSASGFAQRRNETLPSGTGFTCVRLYGKSVRDEILKLKNKFDEIVIDVCGGGQDTQSLRAAMTITDVMLMPFIPSMYDLATYSKMEDLTALLRQVNPDMKVFSLLNRTEPRGNRSDSAADILQEGGQEIQYLNCRISSRMTYADAAISGLSVVEYTPRNSKAIGEIENLYSSLYN